MVSLTSITAFDALVTEWVFANRSDTAAHMLYILSYFGEVAVVAALVVAFLYYFVSRGWGVYTYGLLLSFIGTEACVYAIKHVIGRARPDSLFAFYTETSASFPSGHASIGMAFYGYLAYVLFQNATTRRVRFAIVVSAVLVIVLVGWSRIYLGVHYVSDVLAGYLLGGIWLLLSIALTEMLRGRLKWWKA